MKPKYIFNRRSIISSLAEIQTKEHILNVIYFYSQKLSIRIRISGNVYIMLNVYIRAKINAPITIKNALIVIFGVIAELHKSVPQQTLANVELPSIYK